MPDGQVVITRPLQQAEPLARAVAAIGRTPVVLPLLEISPLDDPSQLTGTLARLDRYALVAFVSPNAVDCAFAHLDGWPDGVEIAVVGEGSRLALARHGVTHERVRIHAPLDPAQSDSDGLVQALGDGGLDRLRGRRVLVVRGETGRELLPDALRSAGAEVDTVAAYRRTLPRLLPALAASLRSLLAGPNDWIITSSEALRGLVDLVRELDNTEASAAYMTKLQQQRLVVPHARIAETAQALGFVRLTLSGSGDDRILAALQSYA